ncbi:hypothetical protein BH10BAC5_BH10BAC5_03310 [soil metagenome]
MKYLFVFLSASMLLSCNITTKAPPSATDNQALLNAKENSLDSLEKSKHEDYRSDAADKTGNPEYEILYNNDSRTQSSFTVFIKKENIYDIIDISEKLLKKANKQGEINVNFFNNKTAAVNFVENQGNPEYSKKVKSELLSNHIYKFTYLPNGRKALYKNSNNSWMEIKSE